MDIEDVFPLVNFQQKSNITIMILDNSYVDGLPVIDMSQLDGDYCYGIHKKIFDYFSPNYNIEIIHQTIKMKRK
jgi:hypothetical protein